MNCGTDKCSSDKYDWYGNLETESYDCCETNSIGEAATCFDGYVV